MKKFAFPLEKVRAYREQNCRREEAALDHMLGHARILEARRTALLHEAFASPEEVTDAASLSALAQYRNYARREEIRLTQETIRLAAAISGQREKLVEVRKDTEVLNQLRDDRLNAWRREADTEQEQLVADLVTARWKRGR